MSSTATRTFAISGVYFPYTLEGNYAWGTESLSEAVAVEGDGKYLIMEVVGDFFSVLMSPAYDGSIPISCAIDSITLDAVVTRGKGVDGNIKLPLRIVGEEVVTSFQDTLPLLPSNSLITFDVTPNFNQRFELNAVDVWQNVTGVFTSASLNALVVQDLPKYYLGFGASAIALNGFLAIDKASVDVVFTLTHTPSAPTVYETTPYSTKVRSAVEATGQFSTTYPLTVWFEWSDVDPTNATDYPSHTTPVQTFTNTVTVATLARVPVNVYDTLPSPLNVQNPNSSLRPNSTYWVRTVSELNGEQVVSAWTSFTTPLLDKAVL